MDSIEITPIEGPVNGALRPPGSKSITNRVLLIAALATGNSVLRGALFSDDTHVMIESLRRLGISVSLDLEKQEIELIGGNGALPVTSASLFVDNSGTTIRFLTAVLGLMGGQYQLDGIPRMRERPIGPLIDALSEIGVNLKAESVGKCPPVSIDSTRVVGGELSIQGNVSSQYLSGLLMAAPLAERGLTINIDGSLISRPYVEMTIEVMKTFGVTCSPSASFQQFKIPANSGYVGREYSIEPDASAASYFWATAAICGGTATVNGLHAHSLQGDIGFVECLQKMGCDVHYEDNSITVNGPAKRGIEIDMSSISDTVQTLSAVALFVKGTTTVRNIAHNRLKETDRIGNLAIELRKLGAQVDEFEDGMSITPGILQGAELETYNDHRMAMSLALVGLKQPGVKIMNPSCVSKTYPDYFQDLQMFCG